MNLAHPTLNQSIPIISYCLPSAIGPDEAQRDRKYLLKKWKEQCVGLCVRVFCGSSLEGESVGLCESGNRKYLEEFSVNCAFKGCISEYDVRLIFSRTDVFGAQF